MRVSHLSPTYFSDKSAIAGAERYVTELAKAMAQRVPTRLVSFGDRARKEWWGPLEVHIYKPLWYMKGVRWNPISFRFLASLWDSEVIHCHQFLTLPTDLAILCGLVSRKRVFVTDLAGNANVSLSYHLPLWRGVHSFLLISRFSQNRYEQFSTPKRVIHGGVDTQLFSPHDSERRQRFLHVGRILPHKGIHLLIQAVPENAGLDVIGAPCDTAYYEELKQMARGKDVTFDTQIEDQTLVEKYRTALATVVPATQDSGFTSVLESLACGTPVIVTDTGALPELVQDGTTGFVIPPNNPTALRKKMEYLLNHPEACRAMGERGRKDVLERFTWDRVVDRCLQAYGIVPQPAPV